MVKKPVKPVSSTASMFSVCPAGPWSAMASTASWAAFTTPSVNWGSAAGDHRSDAAPGADLEQPHINRFGALRPQSDPTRLLAPAVYVIDIEPPAAGGNVCIKGSEAGLDSGGDRRRSFRRVPHDRLRRRWPIQYVLVDRGTRCVLGWMPTLSP